MPILSRPSVWTTDEIMMTSSFIDTGGSIALSALELVAHRNSLNIKTGYKLLFIKLEINDSDITELTMDALPKSWKSIESYPLLHEIGSKWYQSKESLILKVPSALVPWESNYLINTVHPIFTSKVSISDTEDFVWDERLL